MERLVDVEGQLAAVEADGDGRVAAEQDVSDRGAGRVSETACVGEVSETPAGKCEPSDRSACGRR